MIRITYTQGNGYKCGCCRRTNQDYVEFETEEQAVEWLSEKESWQKCPPKTGCWIFPPDDFTVDNIVETKEIWLCGNDARVKEIVDARIAFDAAEKAKQDEESKERDKAMFKALSAVAAAGGFDDKPSPQPPPLPNPLQPVTFNDTVPAKRGASPASSRTPTTTSPGETK